MEPYIDHLIKQIGDTKMRDIPPDVISKGKTAVMEAFETKWDNRPKSNIVKWLMNQSQTNVNVLADYLGCSVPTLNNKIHRDVFSIEELSVICYACDYTLYLGDNKNSNDRKLDAEYFYRTNHRDPKK